MIATFNVANIRLSMAIQVRRSADGTEVFDVNTRNCVPSELLAHIHEDVDYAEITLTWTMDAKRTIGKSPKLLLTAKNAEAELYVRHHALRNGCREFIGAETAKLPAAVVSGLMENYKAEIEEYHQIKKRGL